MLTQESASKEVELHEDDPKAMMVLLRYLYGIPYPTTNPNAEDFSEASLQDHAQVLVVADKYQIPKLRQEAFEKMEIVLEEYNGDFDFGTFVLALQTIFTATTPNSTSRKLMKDFCVDQLYTLRLNDAFMTLLPEIPELAVDIIKHPHLKWAPAGKWVCNGCPYAREDGVIAMCEFCGFDDDDEAHPFEKSFAWQHRNRDVWPCPDCARGGNAMLRYLSR